MLIQNIFKEWKSRGLSNETIKSIAMSNHSLNPKLSYYDSKIKVRFAESCLKQPKVSCTHGTIVNIYIIYELGASSLLNNDHTLENCLFGGVTLTKNGDIEKYGYSAFGIGFDKRSTFSFPGGWFGQSVLIFGAVMSSSAHIDIKKWHISYGKRTNAMIRTYANSRKNIFD